MKNEISEETEDIMFVQTFSALISRGLLALLFVFVSNNYFKNDTTMIFAVALMFLLVVLILHSSIRVVECLYDTTTFPKRVILVFLETLFPRESLRFLLESLKEDDYE